MKGWTRVFAFLVGMALATGMLRGALAQASSNERPTGVFPISPALCEHMRAHHVLHRGAPVGCNRMNLVRFEHVGFDGQLHRGEIVVMDAAADHVGRIFAALLDLRFPIEKARLMDDYDGDDDAAIADNNTSGFNHRAVEGGNALSVHAYGLAIDVNPKQNPYVRRNRSGMVLSVSPPSSIGYIKRQPSFANPRLGMAESVRDLFAEHGFSTWGGVWPYEVDYQHFAVSRGLALRLARLSPLNAQALFEDKIESYRTCRRAGQSRSFCANRD